MANKLKNILSVLSLLVILFTLISLYFLSKATEGSRQFENYYVYLIVFAILGIAALFFIAIVYLSKLFINYKNRLPGTKLTISLLIRTLVLAFIPILFISFFAIKFLSYEFQTSFDQGINEALNNSLKLSKKSIDIRAVQAYNKTKFITEIISRFDYQELMFRLEQIRKDSEAYELVVFDESGFIMAMASQDQNQIIPTLPDPSELLRSKERGSFFTILPINEDYQIKIITMIERSSSEVYYLQAIYSIPFSVSQLAQQVRNTITERDKFNFIKPKISNTLTFTLLLIICAMSLLLLLSTIHFANNMTQPIRDLLKGTIKVAKGDFSQQFKTTRKDDFGTLIRSFNGMTRSLDETTRLAEKNRIEVEKERAYLSSVINHMTSAVITLDYNYNLLTYNLPAERLLESGNNNENYQVFIKALIPILQQGKHIEKEIEVNISNDTKKFITRITPLPVSKDILGGFVIIFDDLGLYWQKQKQAAWEEVARRLAHEIKNPLTPIQLAAERLNYKLTPVLPEKEKSILSRSIEVIINQVKSMKDMVDDFSSYAKPSTERKTVIFLDDLLQEIIDLYSQGEFKNIDYQLHLKANNHQIKGSANALRQVFHNLLKNAIESIDNKVNGCIMIGSENIDNSLIIKVIDNGAGLPDNNQQVFEPYITTKPKGTGLGLAIVKKIMIEHEGEIAIINNQDEGACVTVRFPTYQNSVING